MCKFDTSKNQTQSKPYKISIKTLNSKTYYTAFIIFFLFLGKTPLFSQEIKKEVPILTTSKKTTEVKKTTTDTVKIDTLKVKKSILEGIVKRKAKDYEKLDQKKKELTLYNEAELYYKDIELKAGIIVMNYEKDEVYAGRIKDTAGNYIQYPYFKQGTNVIEPDSIRFNTKTKKALVWNSRTQQQDFRIKAEISKRENDSVYFLKKARFTTSEDIDNPEYYFVANKVKFVPKKKVVVGLTNMVIADVPTPLGLPFAYFPMTEKSVSGFIPPSPGYNNTQGYFLQNGGYYFALSDHYDLAIMGDYYTNGSYSLRTESNYAKRYKYRGNVNLRYQNNIQSERGLPDYSKSTEYMIVWSHGQDGKASANSRFSASVNLGSSQYYRNSLNINDVGRGLNNTMSSSISYQKTFNTVPQTNFSATLNHTQNTNTNLITMTLPNIQGSMDRIFPFAKNDGAKKGIIKNINLSYNLQGRNEITTNDTLFGKAEMFDGAKAGFQHSIPISTNFKVFKYFSVTASTQYNEVWTFNTLKKGYDATEDTLVSKQINKFDSYRTYNFSANIGTTIYGTFKFGKDAKIQAIRHVIRPSVGYSYTPSFDQYYDPIIIDANGTTKGDYTRFENSIYGAPSRSFSNMMTINVTNNFEAKVRDEDDPEKPKKVMLLNNLSFGSSYNLDTNLWSTVSMNGGTTLFKDRLSLNFNSTLNLYAIDEKGTQTTQLNINKGGSLFRMTNAGLQMGFSLSEKDFQKTEKSSSDKKDNEPKDDNGKTGKDVFGNTDLNNNDVSLFDTKKKDDESKEIEWYASKLPWTLRIAYTMNYTNTNRNPEINNNSLMASGDITLTPKWMVGFSTGYDFANKGLTFTNLRFERDLLSWRMSFNWNPIGYNKYWSFFIGIKSSILSDIKWDKQSLPDRRLR